MQSGTLRLIRRIGASRAVTFDAWTKLEHRKRWFVGPDWTEIARSLDLRVGGTEVAHGRFASGVETIYTARFHLIQPNERLIYSFDMQVAGMPFSVSLAAVELSEVEGGTELTYVEHGFFLQGTYDAAAREAGTNGLLDRFAAHVSQLLR